MPELAPGVEALVRLAAALATREPAHVERALRRAASEADASAVDEVLLQAHLFVGFPDALEAMRRWRELSARAAPAAVAGDDAAWPARGERVCAAVYGDHYDKLRAHVVALHPDLDAWMVGGGYGRVLGRPALDLATRELCNVALLAVWRAPRQLHSHLWGALNVGAPVAAVARALQVAAEFQDAASAAAVQALWREVRTRAAARALTATL